MAKAALYKGKHSNQQPSAINWAMYNISTQIIAKTMQQELYKVPIKTV